MSAPTRLAQIAAALRAEKPELAAWLADALASIDQGAAPLRALGLARGPGQRRPATVADHALRSQLLRTAATTCFAGLSKWSQATKLAEGLARYRSTAWDRERDRTDCRQRHIGRPEEFYWRICKAVDCDLGVKSIYRIICS